MVKGELDEFGNPVVLGLAGSDGVCTGLNRGQGDHLRLSQQNMMIYLEYLSGKDISNLARKYKVRKGAIEYHCKLVKKRLGDIQAVHFQEALKSLFHVAFNSLERLIMEGDPNVVVSYMKGVQAFVPRTEKQKNIVHMNYDRLRADLNINLIHNSAITQDYGKVVDSSYEVKELSNEEV